MGLTFRCPSDRVLSDLQRDAEWRGRTRSISMNAMVGNAGSFMTEEYNVNNPAYRQFTRLTQIPEPSLLFVFVEEHPDSINARHFGTREHSTSPARLTIDYEPTATLEPVIIGDVAAADGELTFAIDACAGVGYRIEFREGMAGTTWQTITNFPPSESSSRLEVRHAIQSSAGLYRVESAAAP